VHQHAGLTLLRRCYRCAKLVLEKQWAAHEAECLERCRKSDAGRKQ
jgi:hypothetical protein